MYGDIRDDWKLRAVEAKADEAKRLAYEVNSRLGNVDGLVCTLRELSSTVDGLRYELQDEIQRLKERVEELEHA